MRVYVCVCVVYLLLVCLRLLNLVLSVHWRGHVHCGDTEEVVIEDLEVDLIVNKNPWVTQFDR